MAFALVERAARAKNKANKIARTIPVLAPISIRARLKNSFVLLASIVRNERLIVGE